MKIGKFEFYYRGWSRRWYIAYWIGTTRVYGLGPIAVMRSNARTLGRPVTLGVPKKYNGSSKFEKRDGRGVS